MVERNNEFNENGKKKSENLAFSLSGSESESAWSRTMGTFAFAELVRRKKRFVNPTLVVSLALFSVVTVFATFTTVLDGQVVGPLTWGFLCNLIFFAVSLLLSYLYARNAKGWDRLAHQAQVEVTEGETEK